MLLLCTSVTAVLNPWLKNAELQMCLKTGKTAGWSTQVVVTTLLQRHV